MEKNDSQEIEILPWPEPIRRRSHLYVGDLLDPHVSTAFLLQSLCHAIDEAIDGRCSIVKILVQEFGAVIEYDAGLPLHPVRNGQVPAVVILMSSPRGCSNMKKHIEVGSEYCEFGIAVLNALCCNFSVVTYSDGQQAKLNFKAGKLQHPVSLQKAEHDDFTRMAFQLDDAILPRFTFSEEAIRNRARDISVKYDISIEVSMEG